MLLTVLLLVVVAGVVLASAVVSGQPDVAWFSVLASALGVLLLVVERARHRRAPSGSAGPPVEVMVIDERPHYHRRDCDLVGERRTIALHNDEARELGFTPCRRCRPDTPSVAQAHRGSALNRGGR
ncbi:hypothetical protein GCM10009545_22820 [Saccharopolyspora thermophila]|uniref:Ada DNA repair metal-binding domain-containing protein n=1 Tax=Saccharopolyspora thermophila TaxID=89367 RepID=A0ABN1CJK1_9PSEU